MRPLPTIRVLPGFARRGMTPVTAALVTALIIALGAGAAWSQVCVQDNCQPPPGSSYGSTHHDVFTFPSTVDLSNLVLHNFSVCGAPPPDSPGAAVVITFNAVADFVWDDGVPSNRTAPATVTIRVAFNHLTGATRFFDTEMLSLDLVGGTLPPLARMRESPTRASLGQTSVQDLGGGNFKMDSFFDVFFELSRDNGVTWAPSTTGPGHTTIAGPSCPTPTRASSWGRIKITYR